MSPAAEKLFERIAQKVVMDCEAITCPIGDFYEGLRLIVERLVERIQCESYDKGHEVDD